MPLPVRAVRSLAPLAVSLAVPLAAACSLAVTDPATSEGPGADGGVGDALAAADAAAATDGAAPTGDWTLGAPFATEAPPFAKARHALAPSPRWGALTAPYPTNAAWQDLVLGAGTNTFAVFPYTVKALDTGLEASFPRRLAQATSVLSVFERDVAFGATEALGVRVVTGYDDLSVTLRWPAASGGSLVAPIVRGMAYVTAKYDRLTPTIGSAHAILTVDGAPPAATTGERFVVATNDGSTWVIYASAPIALAPAAGGLVATGPFTGTLRAARVLEPSQLAALDAHRGAVPTGGAVEAAVTGDAADVAFRWTREGTGPLAMATLPHHRTTLTEAARALGVTYPTLRGPMTLVEGDRWSFRQPLVPLGWSAPRAVPEARAAAIRAALVEDAKVGPTADDPYFFGKQAARLGRLALIADELGDAATATAVRARLAAALDGWLGSAQASPLVYDEVWRGVVSRKGLADRGADFGNGWYNDHHFHYGYFLYAAAALGKGDPAWLARHRAAILTLARDVANPSAADTAFTRFRSFDWFEGHGWAAGLFEFGDGRNQESSSEAVNAWYGLDLLGRALGDANVSNVGRILLATEILGATTYWQVTKGGGIYDEPFATHGVVGILWGGKVDYTTFFGQKPELIFGIQMLPFTPVTEALLGKAWVTEAWPRLAGPAAAAEPGWRGFLYGAHAVIDPGAGWDELAALSAWDDGNSRSNALYWAATRP